MRKRGVGIDRPISREALLGLNRDIVARFLRLVRIPEPWGNLCWDWTGARNEDGYGRFSAKLTALRKGAEPPVPAHRIAYALQYGEVPADREVMHECHNPSCVNPTHLALGTRQENIDASKDLKEFAGTFAKAVHVVIPPAPIWEGWGIDWNRALEAYQQDAVAYSESQRGDEMAND